MNKLFSQLSLFSIFVVFIASASCIRTTFGRLGGCLRAWLKFKIRNINQISLWAPVTKKTGQFDPAPATLPPPTAKNKDRAPDIQSFETTALETTAENFLKKSWN
jgi:hypothetical protein